MVFSLLAGDESTSQEATAVPERERPTNKQDTENTMHSEPARNAENVTVQKRISAKMRKKTLEAYKQAYLVPAKLNNRKASLSEQGDTGACRLYCA